MNSSLGRVTFVLPSYTTSLIADEYPWFSSIDWYVLLLLNGITFYSFCRPSALRSWQGLKLRFGVERL